MTIRELITQPLNEDMDAEVCIAVNGRKSGDSVDIDGIRIADSGTVFLVPDQSLVTQS